MFIVINVFKNVFKSLNCNRKVFKLLKPGGNMVQLVKMRKYFKV